MSCLSVSMTSLPDLEAELVGGVGALDCELKGSLAREVGPSGEPADCIGLPVDSRL